MPVSQRADKTESAWKVTVIPSVIGGLNTKDAPYLIDSAVSPNLENMAFKYGRAIQAIGYNDFGYAGDHIAVRGDPQAVFEHTSLAGAVSLILVTKLAVYKRNGSTLKWEYVSDGVKTTLAANWTVGSDVTLTSATGFAIGDKVGITLDDGTQIQANIDNLVGAVATLDASFISTATAGNAFIRSVHLSGGDTYQVDHTPFPPTVWTVFTNGVDVPRYFDGTDVLKIQNLPTPADTVCRVVTYYKGALLLGDITEGGVRDPRRELGSFQGDASVWTGVGTEDRTLIELRDAITAMEPLGDINVIYSNSMIMQQRLLANDEFTYQYEIAVFGDSSDSSGVGAVSPNAVFATADQHIIISRSGIYQYNGDRSVRNVSEDIFDGLFDVAGIVDVGKIDKSFVQYIAHFREVWCFVPYSGDTFPSLVLIMRLNDAESSFVRSSVVWRKRRLNKQMRFSGTNTRSITPTIAGLTGTIIEQQWVIGTPSIIPVSIIVGSDPTPGLWEFSPFAPDEDGAGIAWFIDTLDIRNIDRTQRLDAIDIDAAGSNIAVQYSKDAGRTFTTLGTISPGVVPKVTRVTADQDIAEQFRIRLSGTGGGVSIGAIALRHREESRWTL